MTLLRGQTIAHDVVLQPDAQPTTLATSGQSGIGQTVNLNFSSPSDPGRAYFLPAISQTTEYTRRRAITFLEHFAVTGNQSKAAELAGVNRRTPYYWKRSIPEFAVLWDQAADMAADKLEEEARRRAEDGWLQDVYQKGEYAGRIRLYSDRLMEVMLKARRPDKFADRQRIDVNQRSVSFTFNNLERNADPIKLDQLEREAKGKIIDVTQLSDEQAELVKESVTKAQPKEDNTTEMEENKP